MSQQQSQQSRQPQREAEEEEREMDSVRDTLLALLLEPEPARSEQSPQSWRSQGHMRAYIRDVMEHTDASNRADSRFWRAVGGLMEEPLSPDPEEELVRAEWELITELRKHHYEPFAACLAEQRLMLARYMLYGAGEGEDADARFEAYARDVAVRLGAAELEMDARSREAARVIGSMEVDKLWTAVSRLVW